MTSEMPEVVMLRILSSTTGLSPDDQARLDELEHSEAVARARLDADRRARLRFSAAGEILT